MECHDEPGIFCLVIYDPHPNLPPRGKEIQENVAPLGETTKGVLNANIHF